MSIYFDNCATTPMYQEVIDGMTDCFKNNFGNPSSLHTLGIRAEKSITDARRILARFLNCKEKNLFFTSGATEANNMAVTGYINANKHNSKHIITSKLEHPSVLEQFKYLETQGYEVEYVNVLESGIIDITHLREIVRKDTALVSCMLVNNEIGSIQPVDKIKSILTSIGSRAVIHIDAVQAFGKVKIDVRKLKADIISISGHKIFGPKGIGAIYIGDNIKIEPRAIGGGQEKNIRPGTENTPGIVGFGIAAEKIHNDMEQNRELYIALRHEFLTKLSESDVEYTVNSPTDGLPNILNISFIGIRSEIMLHHLEQKGIYVSSGSACSSNKHAASATLKAIGVSSLVADCAIRISFGYYNTLDEVDKCVDCICDIYSKLR